MIRCNASAAAALPFAHPEVYMATRSMIGRQNADGTVSGLYCHFDGSPEHQIPILLQHFATQDRVDALISAGDIWSLGPDLEKNRTNWRGAMSHDAIIYQDTLRFMSHHYHIYLFANSEWWYSRGVGTMVLAETMVNKE